MKPLIVLTNDDGIESPGLRAAAQAVADLGELLIVAPKDQQSSIGRAFIGDVEPSFAVEYAVNGKSVRAYAAPCTPAVAARHAILLLANRKPALVIAGINYGENIGSGVTISGTLGAALDAATQNVPALAVSVATPREFHRSHSAEIDFAASAHFTRVFAEKILRAGLPRAADVINVNVPQTATPQTLWRWTRVSRELYFVSTIEEKNGRKNFTGYAVGYNVENLERDSDIYAVCEEGIVSVTPITFDLTARVEPSELQVWEK
ncbi:MAG: 5'/3'-nucleotidase SurE [Chloroflexi bacterium]|nr:5'/3'-nucleotidase SurE [Chloroflexota bacterium]